MNYFYYSICKIWEFFAYLLCEVNDFLRSGWSNIDLVAGWSLEILECDNI